MDGAMVGERPRRPHRYRGAARGGVQEPCPLTWKSGGAWKAFFYPPKGLWYIRRSSGGRVTPEVFGGRDYVPLRGDFELRR
jgi:hypothetical protein